jgi:hypothetical protein
VNVKVGARRTERLELEQEQGRWENQHGRLAGEEEGNAAGGGRRGRERQSTNWRDAAVAALRGLCNSQLGVDGVD